MPKVQINPAAVQAVIDLRIDMGAYPPPHEPADRFVDPSYWAEAVT